MVNNDTGMHADCLSLAVNLNFSTNIDLNFVGDSKESSDSNFDFTPKLYSELVF